QAIPLDSAVEVDSSTEFGSKGWTSDDYRSPKKELQPVEQAVEELASKTPASLVLKVLNPDGNLFLLLSGGGASVVILDEIATLANKDVIGNYGEYSGNPNEQDTYLYTKQVIKLMLGSKASKKALLIAGGVANFTDVAKTFKGIIRALDDNIDQLKAQDIHVVVRRGGPNQKQGLGLMKNYLESKGLNSQVYGTEMSLGRAVQSTVQELGL
ncbi:MAG: ATP citrate lyase citrate-binding domain-containing protein, partial [Patescibacteria group bacterium]